MSNEYFNPPNSIWPNGLKKDDESCAIFYPLGTNKVNVPINSSEWPKGDTLVSPFVYQDDRLVGFIDTEALTVSEPVTIYLPYKHIEADFSSINKGDLSIHAPKAETKNAKWSDSDKETIGEASFKYKGCKSVDDVKGVDSSYTTTDISSDGVWSEALWDLEASGNVYANEALFYNCANLTSFSADLPNLTVAVGMFYGCTNLATFNSDLSSLISGNYMFFNCDSLTSFSADLSKLTNGGSMFRNCSSLPTFSSNLSSLTNGAFMFNNCTNLTSWNIELPNLASGNNMFTSCYNLTSWNIELPNLTNGDNMFFNCINLASWNVELPNLTNGHAMFCDTNLASWNTELPNLTNGRSMFSDTNLASWNIELPNLTDGGYMFSNTNLSSWNIELPNLVDGFHMFSGCADLSSWYIELLKLSKGPYMFDDCTNLSSFSTDLPSMTKGYLMFCDCTNLTSFNSDLCSLTNGYRMFDNCKLDTTSVQNIADTIKNVNGLTSVSNWDGEIYKTIHIGIGNETPNDQETTAFNTIASKGWTVYVNGSAYTPTSLAAITTLDENGEERTTPIPFYAKPVEATEESAEYVDEQGNFFNIVGAQFIYGDDLSTYGMFTCEADAAANMRLTPYSKNQTNI